MILYWGYTEQLIDQAVRCDMKGLSSAALWESVKHVLVCCAEKTLSARPKLKGSDNLAPVSPTRILKARSLFQNSLSQAVSWLSIDDFPNSFESTFSVTASLPAHTALCFCWLQYLSLDSIEAALQAFDDFALCKFKPPAASFDGFDKASFENCSEDGLRWGGDLSNILHEALMILFRAPT